jgi:hypothetical protein
VDSGGNMGFGYEEMGKSKQGGGCGFPLWLIVAVVVLALLLCG